MRWEITKAGVIFSLIYQPCSFFFLHFRDGNAWPDVQYGFNKAPCCLLLMILLD